MTVVRYITHAEVVVDPAVPVPDWGLSERGRARVGAMLDQPWVGAVGRIVSSSETKALETAAIVAGHLGIPVERRDDTGEIDRSVPGFLPPDEFEVVADACFAHPDVSARGWEPAAAAQRRIVRALADLLAPAGPDTAVIGHGGVGTLWFCHLAALPIARRWDQPGQGHYVTVVDGAPLHHWRPIDVVAASGPEGVQAGGWSRS
ncbi:MAG TPA: histidine phosphatase family protein [Ilumatobacteraceae bacterium]|nr:histidine phosphatase family protein [Ilumatobacteraceae bacterium]